MQIPVNSDPAVQLPPSTALSGYRIPLNTSWTFRKQQRTADESNPDAPASPLSLLDTPLWLPTAGFPTTVHQDLLSHGLIPDPHVGRNEEDLQYLNDLSWEYRTLFSTPPIGALVGHKAVLKFEGLDTFAQIFINGTQVLKTDNMFRTYTVHVTNHLHKDGRSNELLLVFDSAEVRGKEIMSRYPNHKWGCWNGDVERLAVRKAQYHWGWDWGPKFLTAGPWRPITLDIYTARIEDMYVSSVVDVDAKQATVSVSVETATSGSPRPLATRVTIALDSFSQSTVIRGAEKAVFDIQDAQIWYPFRYGQQPRYLVTAKLISDGENPTVFDVQSQRHGIRKVELIERPLTFDSGTTFFLQINNIPVFCGGTNWIPATSFLPSTTAEDYKSWLQLARDGNQTMVRVWGGGIYEEDLFYDAADDLGILIWQDFMFACGNCPTYGGFLRNVLGESRDNVRRLRKHPSLVIWAGNNEDYQYAESAKLHWDPKDLHPEGWLRSDFPARYIYEMILPDTCRRLSPDIPYHPGSPFGGVNTRDQTVGDLHQWDVWHGSQEPYQDFGKLSGRFVSEFGMQAFPSPRTIDSFLPKGAQDPDRFAGSRTIDFHNKASGAPRRLGLYMAENMRTNMNDLEAYAHATQVMQADCLSTAIRSWKTKWAGKGKEECAGALVWQLNDVWAGVSWSIVDVFRRPKIAYYAIKRELADVSVGIERIGESVESGSAEPVTMHISGCNLTMEKKQVQVLIKTFDVESGEMLKSVKTQVQDLAANQSTELLVTAIEVRAYRTVTAVYLLENGIKIAKAVSWPEPLRQLRLPKPKMLKINHIGNLVRVDANVPIKALMLETKTDNVKWSDNGFDVVPGDDILLTVTGLPANEPITARYLGMDF